MKFKFKVIILKLLFLVSFGIVNFSYADSHNIYETLEIIKNDLKTLERAVYSGSIDVSQTTSENSNIELGSNWIPIPNHNQRCVMDTSYETSYQSQSANLSQ